MLYIIAYIFFKWLLWLIYRPKVFGNKKNLRLKGGVIFIANHRALYDPLLLVVSSPRIIHFMAKKELFDNPVGRVFFKSLFVFPVNRKTADMKSIRQSLKLLRDGKAFGIFPEGRRSATDGMDEFEKGTAFIAAKSGAPIVPIYINPKKSRSGRSLLYVGDVILPGEIAEHCDRRMLNDAITNRMQNEMEKLSLLMRGETEGKKRTARD